METTPLQQYIDFINQWVAIAKTDQVWDQLPELRQPAQAIAQLAEDIVIWLDFKGYAGDAQFFLEEIGQCNEAMLQVYLWAKQYPQWLPKDNPSCRDAIGTVLTYVYGDIQKTQWLNEKLPQEVWDGFDRR